MIAALQLGPNADAFIGGVAVVLSAVFVILVAIGGLALFRRIVGA